jgi:hypothetical protein
MAKKKQTRDVPLPSSDGMFGGPKGATLKDRMKRDNAETSEARNFFRPMEDFEAKGSINKAATKARIDQRRKEIYKKVDAKMAAKKKK